MSGYFIRKARVVGPHNVCKEDIWIDGGRIVAIGKLRPVAGLRTIVADGLYALPGFIDLHMHGGGGFDATQGKFDAKHRKFDGSPKAYQSALPKLMSRLAGFGVTRALLATTAAPLKDLEHALRQMSRYLGFPAFRAFRGHTQYRSALRLLITERGANEGIIFFVLIR